MAGINDKNAQYQEALRRQQEYAKRSAAHAAGQPEQSHNTVASASQAAQPTTSVGQEAPGSASPAAAAAVAAAVPAATAAPAAAASKAASSAARRVGGNIKDWEDDTAIDDGGFAAVAGPAQTRHHHSSSHHSSRRHHHSSHRHHRSSSSAESTAADPTASAVATAGQAAPAAALSGSAAAATPAALGVSTMPSTQSMRATVAPGATVPAADPATRPYPSPQVSSAATSPAGASAEDFIEVGDFTPVRSVGTNKQQGRRRKKKHPVRRALLAILAVVLLAAVGIGAYGAWYMNSLASNMAMNTEDQKALDEVLAPVDNAAKPYYVLLIGSDNWETYGERSDALMLIRVDQATHKVTMVSVPRDTPYELNGKTVKLNQAFAEGGPTAAVEAVQSVTGVSISYYAEIQFAGLADFVDSIGGITVNVPYTIDYIVYTHDQDTVHIDAGQQTLNGTQAVALARMRSSYTDQNQDAARQANVRAMTVALMSTVLHKPVTEIPGVVQQLSTCVSTSMGMNTLTSLALDFAQADTTTLYTCTGPTAGALDEATGLWLCYPNEDGWQKIMAAVESGEDPGPVADEVNAADQVLQGTGATSSTSTTVEGAQGASEQ